MFDDPQFLGCFSALFKGESSQNCLTWQSPELHKFSGRICSGLVVSRKFSQFEATWEGSQHGNGLAVPVHQLGSWGGQSSRWTVRGIWRPVFAGGRSWHCWISSSWTSWSFNYGDLGDGVPIYLTVSLWVEKYAVSERFWRWCVQFPLHPFRWIDRRTHSFKMSIKGVRAALLGVIHDRFFSTCPMIPLRYPNCVR